MAEPDSREPVDGGDWVGHAPAYYEVQAKRVEPVGLAYLWPETNRAGYSTAPSAASISWSRTTRSCSLSTPGNNSRNWSIVAPSRRFSNRADTGTRVPRNTRAPLTFSGSRSTAGQAFQVVMVSSASDREASERRCSIIRSWRLGTLRRASFACRRVDADRQSHTLDRADVVEVRDNRFEVRVAENGDTWIEQLPW